MFFLQLTSILLQFGSPNKLDVNLSHGAKAWLSSITHPNYEAASKAIERVYGMKPDYTREGGSIPITSAFEDCTQMNVLFKNEKFDRLNLVNAIKVLGVYLHELGSIKGPKPSLCRCEPLSEADLMIPGAFLKGFKCKCEI